MTIDDIYYAAINGEKERLIELLKNNEETKQVDINEMLDGGTNNGVHSSFTVLFSILWQMHQNGFNREIMDILVRYGIDLNTRVKVSSDAFTRHIPLLAYFIRDWNQPEMVRYFLEHGADPNIAQEEKYADGHYENYQAAYFAIMFNENINILNMLLEYGAHPNLQVFTYNYEEAMQQRLPLLFFALVRAQSKEKCIALFSYGAFIDTETIVGDRWNNKWKFNKYISAVYPQFTRMLDDAYQQGLRNSKKVNNIYLKNQLSEDLKENTDKKEEVFTDEQPKKKEVSTFLKELNDSVYALLDFDKQNRKAYFDAKEAAQADVGLFGRGKKQKMEAEETLARIKSQRAGLLDKINRLDAQTDSTKKRWWNFASGLTCDRSMGYEVMIWMPLSRLIEMPDGLGVCSHCTVSDSITEQEVQLLVKAKAISPIYLGEPDPFKKYHLAELCMWTVEDATKIHQYEEALYNDEQVKQASRERMDNHERFFNFLSNHVPCTNEEMALGGQMSASDYFMAEMLRNDLMDRYENKMRNATRTVYDIENAMQFTHKYRPIGIVLFDMSHNISAVYTYNELRKTEVYLLDANKSVYDIKKIGPDGNIDRDRKYAIRNLKGFDICKADVLAEMPDYYTEQEWYDFVFQCHEIPGKKYRDEKIAEAYRYAGFKKRETLHSI